MDPDPDPEECIEVVNDDQCQKCLEEPFPCVTSDTKKKKKRRATAEEEDSSEEEEETPVGKKHYCGIGRNPNLPPKKPRRVKRRRSGLKRSRKGSPKTPVPEQPDPEQPEPDTAEGSNANLLSTADELGDDDSLRRSSSSTTGLKDRRNGLRPSTSLPRIPVFEEPEPDTEWLKYILVLTVVGLIGIGILQYTARNKY